MHHLRQSPCKDCKDRSFDPPCHDICKKYLAYHTDVIEIRKRREDSNAKQRLYMEAVERRKKLRNE